MIAQNVAFGIIAAAMCVAAIRVVTTKNVVHAALYLVVVLAGVGMNFILLAAEFTAVTQVIVYIGAVVVLFLFGIMLTRAPIGRSADLDNDQRWLAAAHRVLLLGVLVVRARGRLRQRRSSSSSSPRRRPRSATRSSRPS